MNQPLVVFNTSDLLKVYIAFNTGWLLKQRLL
jgi:hypothetical protein